MGDERRRREKRGAEDAEGVECGEGCPLPAEEGSGEGAVPPPQKKFDYLTLKWCIFSAHLRYSDALILKFCMTQCKLKIV